MIFKTTRGITYKSLKADQPEYYELIFSKITEEDISLSERIWLHQNNLTEIPKCLNCDNKVSFKKFYIGYKKYCSRKCAAIHTHNNEEIKSNRLKGFTKANNDKETRKEMTEKSNITKSLFTDAQKENTKEKRRNTNMIKYGHDNVSSSIEIKEKISKSLKEVLPFLNINKTINRIENMNLFKIIKIEKDKFYLSCNKCKNDFEISRNLFNQRNRFNIDICTSCNPNNGSSNFEMNVLEYINSKYDGIVISGYRFHKKYELDIYLPQFNIGIECNGLYWHSEIYKDKNYHKNKNDFFKEKNIKVIHIWEDDWKFKIDIVKSRLDNLLKINNTLYARKCIIKEVSAMDTRDFINKNHLQGSVNSKYKIGLYFDNELVSIMTFGNFRKNLGRVSKENQYELLRFCNKMGINVVGGASKLLTYFVRNYNPDKIISYASIDWSNGDLYEKLGLTYIRETPPNYFYFNKDEGIKHNRFNFRKDKLIKEGYDPNMTEHKIMNDRGYYRIYDSGSMLFELSINVK